MRITKSAPVLGIALATALAAPIASGAVVGRVLMAAGEATALRDGRVVNLTFGSGVEDKDTLQTGPRSNLQVRFSDESILSLREQSRLQIEDYKFTGKPDGSESVLLRLVKGGFRTVTGLIGRADHSRYAVRTPSATIGIRGTMYAAGVCDKDCFNADGSLAPDGVYGMVIGQSFGTRRLAITNKAGETLLRPGQIFFVANESSAPELLLEPPAHLLDKLAGAGKAARPTAAAMGFPGKDKEAADALGSMGANAPGGISSDTQPNAFPGILDPIIAYYGQDGVAPQEIRDISAPPLTVISALNGTATSGPVVTNLGGPLAFLANENLAAGTSPGVPSVLPSIQSQGTFVAIGGIGVVRGQMLWTTTADMDLHMLTPDGQEVAYFNPVVNFPSSAPTATATLDIDNTQGINHPTAVTTFQGQRNAVENIAVTGTVVPAGNYKFFIQNFSGVTTAPTLIVTGDSGTTSRLFNVPALTSGAFSPNNYIVTRSASGTATYSSAPR